MPELPEVETTTRLLRKKVLGRTFLDVWTDAEKLVKKPEKFAEFKEKIKGRTIKGVKRRAKYILFELSGGKILLAHQRMTGHFLVGRFQQEEGEWKPERGGPLRDKMNSYIHLLFELDDGRMLALSSLRKFATVELWDKVEFEKKGVLKELGPEPLFPSFTFEEFKKLFKGRRGRIKSLLMNQKFVVGVGNIYSDEILWGAGVNPFKKADELSEKEKRKIYKNMKKVFKRALKEKGTSVADYRTPEGEKGGFGKLLKVYGREGEECPRCGREIKRKKISGRSAHFCPHCQQ